MLRHAGAAAHLDSPLAKRLVGRLARPHEGFARAEVRHFLRGQIAQGGVGLLGVLEPLLGCLPNREPGLLFPPSSLPGATLL